MKKKIPISIILIILFISGFYLYKKISNKQNLVTQKTYNTAQTKIDIEKLCPSLECNLNLGIVNINNQNLPLSFSKNIITLGNNSLDINTIHIPENIPKIKPEIKDIVIYNNYLIIYSTFGKTENNTYSSNTNSYDDTNYYNYSIQIYDQNLKYINSLDGTTCAPSSNFNISNNGILTYNSFETIDNLKKIIIDSKNVKKFTELDATCQINITDIINQKYDNIKSISINYSCGVAHGD